MNLSRRTFLHLAGGGAGILAAPGIGGLVAGHKGVEVGGDREESLWTTEAPSIPPAPRLDDDRKVDLAIIETGIGGRYDATSLLEPAVTVVTSVEREHTAVLGRTEAEILSQKLGIARPGIYCLLLQGNGVQEAP